MDTSAGILSNPKRTQRELKNQIASAKHARSTLDAYLVACNAGNLAVSQLSERFANHAFLARKLDNDILDLEQELASSAIQKQIPAEEDESARLPWRVAIDVWAPTDDEEAEVYSDPEDGVEIVDIQEIKRMDWMAPETLNKESIRKGKRVKQERTLGTRMKGQKIILICLCNEFY